MKTLATSAVVFALAAGVLGAHAQTPATRASQPSPTQPASNSKPAAPSVPYKGPRVVKDTKALGQKMIKESKPTDMRMPVPVRTAPK